MENLFFYFIVFCYGVGIKSSMIDKLSKDLSAFGLKIMGGFQRSALQAKPDIIVPAGVSFALIISAGTRFWQYFIDDCLAMNLPLDPYDLAQHPLDDFTKAMLIPIAYQWGGRLLSSLGSALFAVSTICFFVE